MIPVKIDQFNKKTISPSKQTKKDLVDYFKCLSSHEHLSCSVLNNFSAPLVALRPCSQILQHQNNTLFKDG